MAIYVKKITFAGAVSVDLRSFVDWSKCSMITIKKC